MIRFIKRHFGLLLLVLLGVTAYVALNRPTPPPTVTLVQVEQAPIIRVLAMNGRVRAMDTADIKPRRAGRLLSINVTEGDMVKAGDVLGAVDAQQLTASLAQVKAELDRARANAAQAARDVARIQKLARDGYATTARLEAEKLKQTLAAKDVQAAQAVLDKAQGDSDDTLLTAPFDGVVQKIAVDIGTTVALDTSVFTIARTGPQDIEAEADEIYAPALKLGQGVVVATPTTNKPVAAKVSWVAPNIDTRTGGLVLRVNGDAINQLPPGLSVSLTVTVDQVASGLVLPRETVVSPQNDPYVLVYDAVSKTLKKQNITLVDWPAEKVQILSGLTDKQKVATTPRAFEPGQVVQVKDAVESKSKTK